MSASALIYSAKDARAAAAALDSHDPVAAGRYTDEAMTYERELRRRRAYQPPEHPINRVPVNGREPRVPQAVDAYQRANSCAARAIEHRLTVRANRLDSARFEAAAKYGSAVLDGIGADTWVEHWANRYHRLNVLVRRLDERIANADDRPCVQDPVL